MTEYLNYTFTDDDHFISTFDEAPLWSAAFGILLLKHITLKPKMILVDVGSGSGFPLLELAGRLGSDSKLYGVDPWKHAQSRAKLKAEHYGYKTIELIEASAEKIPLEDHSVDLIISNLGINNFENPDEVFKESRRILKTGGKLALTTNVNGHWKLFYDLFEAALKQIHKERYIEALITQQERRGDVASISKLFTDAGFIVTDVKEDTLDMNFVNGSAFLNHHFVKLGWMSSWLEIFPKDEHRVIFSALERHLNTHSEHHGGLLLQVPMVFMQGEK